MNEIYERLSHETSKAYHHFAAYRDMGSTRSLQKVAKRYKMSRAPLGRLSKKYNWVERAKAYDLHMERVKMEAREIVELERERRHIEHVELYEKVGKEALLYLMKLLKGPYTNPDGKKMIVDLLVKYPTAYTEMIEVGRSTQILEKERAESLIRQDDDRDVQQDRKISAPVEQTDVEPVEEKASAPQNVLSLTGVERNGERKEEAKETSRNNRRLLRR